MTLQSELDEIADEHAKTFTKYPDEALLRMVRGAVSKGFVYAVLLMDEELETLIEDDPEQETDTHDPQRT